MEKVKKALNESAALRWGVLILLGFVLSTNYYFYDAFSTLKDLLKAEFNFTNTDYGLMYSIQNLGLWGFPLLAGILLDKTNPGNPEVADYTAPILMFAALGFIGLIFALMLKREDKKNQFGVELPLNKQ